MENEQPKTKGSKTMTYAIIGVLAVALIGGGIFLLTRNNGGNNNGGTPEVVEPTVVTAAELNGEKAVTIAYGDYEAMQTLASDIQNGRMTGKIVEIDGIVSHPGTSYSITEANSDGTAKIGTVFNIKDSTTYPADGKHVRVIAKVIEVSAMNFQLATLKDFVEEVK